MLRYMVSRLAVVILVTVVVLLLTFTMGYYAAGDPILLIYGEDVSQLTPESVARLRHDLGLDRPYWEQFFDYVRNAVQGDLGRSIATKIPVTDLITKSLPISVQLGLLATLFLAAVGVPLGILAALHHNTWADYLIVGLALFLRSVPVFVLGPLLLILFVLQLNLMDVPSGWQGIGHTSVLLPVFLLAAYPLADVIRQTRAGVLEVLQEDYIRTARAKGLSRSVVVRRHVLRNALVPVVTSLGLIVNGLIHGSVFLDRIFGLPGFGQLVVNGVQLLDFPVILGTTVFSALLVIGTNLLVDMTYPFLDPRVKDDAGSRRP